MMDDMQDKLNAVLGNPDMMAQIMSMAQSLGGGTASPAPPPPQPPGMPDGMDPAMIAKLAGMASSASVDKDQQALLHALRPYLTQNRISKLEKAMRAAKLAGLVTTLLGNSMITRTGR